MSGSRRERQEATRHVKGDEWEWLIHHITGVRVVDGNGTVRTWMGLDPGASAVVSHENGGIFIRPARTTDSQIGHMDLAHGETVVDDAYKVTLRDIGRAPVGEWRQAPMSRGHGMKMSVDGKGVLTITSYYGESDEDMTGKYLRLSRQLDAGWVGDMTMNVGCDRMLVMDRTGHLTAVDGGNGLTMSFDGGRTIGVTPEDGNGRTELLMGETRMTPGMVLRMPFYRDVRVTTPGAQTTISNAAGWSLLAQNDDGHLTLILEPLGWHDENQDTDDRINGTRLAGTPSDHTLLSGQNMIRAIGQRSILRERYRTVFSHLYTGYQANLAIRLYATDVDIHCVDDDTFGFRPSEGRLWLLLDTKGRATLVDDGNLTARGESRMGRMMAGRTSFTAWPIGVNGRTLAIDENRLFYLHGYDSLVVDRIEHGPRRGHDIYRATSRPTRGWSMTITTKGDRSTLSVREGEFDPDPRIIPDMEAIWTSTLVGIVGGAIRNEDVGDFLLYWNDDPPMTTTGGAQCDDAEDVDLGDIDLSDVDLGADDMAELGVGALDFDEPDLSEREFTRSTGDGDADATERGTLSGPDWREIAPSHQRGGR